MRHFRSVPAALSLLFCAASACAGPVIQLKPGLWASDTEIWINGQSMKPALQALRDNVRRQLSEAERQEFDKEQAAGKHACLTPQQSRVDLARYLETALGDAGGPWRCEVTPATLDASTANGSFACRTDGGGLSQGRFSATYGPAQYRLELNGRGNAVDGHTGQALGGEVDQRMLATGRWLKSSC
jgi:hypothetical protein